MKSVLIFSIFCSLAGAPAGAGVLTGAVRAEGKPGADADTSGGKYDSRQFKFAERVNYAELRDFVVYIDGPVVTNLAPKTAQVVTGRITQKGAMFTPHVLPVLTGTTVEWPNNDEILHNVFSYSEPKPFDLGLYKSPKLGTVLFDKPGRVDVFCSIHARMNCIVLVLQNPYFAATKDGRYRIADVPAGTYKLKAWHERLPSQVKEITVPENGDAKADFVLGINNLPKP
jgi:plastocyanin